MTATSGDAGTYLVDTSAAVAFLVGGHDHHDTTFEALADRRFGLAGHAAFETFSVLTRLPSLTSLAGHGVAGRSVYDALVGATAAEHGLTLVSRDWRAIDTYRELSVEVEMLS